MLKSFLIICISTSSMAFSFKQAVSELSKHNSVEAIKGSAKSLVESSKQKSSWGDPMFKIAAKNFPVETLDYNQTPMTGLELGISQKIALSNKYGKAKESVNAQARAMNYSALDYEQALIKALWGNVIGNRRIENELFILKENLAWINNILKVSKKLYSNGRITQQALLDIQIRKSEIESEFSNKKFELKQNKAQLVYLLGDQAAKLDYKSVPWHILDKLKNEEVIKDNRLKSLEEGKIAGEFAVEQASLAYIPDITVSLGYTFRSDEIDNNGDYIGAQITFPIPVSDDKRGAKGSAVANRYAAIKKLEDYKLKKNRDLNIIQDNIEKLKSELEIITKKSVNFAQNSRSITSKSYGRGNSSYIELLQSELRLQTILLKKVMLEAQLATSKVDYKYTLGESLYE
ncbi:outer membrane efflux protein [Bacteriovorax sp. BAL6_X]|uniref:TolC family protein n=1 Tax=Bacteriovorax sp. BAL6_X TaxID=1201290 RepID=UPI000385606B|nr:TolC family protein [Bacteriovorax sp. BAL6_X]EPZ49335.1 outer membrane efflux protein [Bacteriovorax sp. BAL6_X]